MIEITIRVGEHRKRMCVSEESFQSLRFQKRCIGQMVIDTINDILNHPEQEKGDSNETTPDTP